MNSFGIATDEEEPPLDPVLVRLYATDDASVWANEFCKTAKTLGHDLDEGWMVGWFANAIETAKALQAKQP